MIGLADLRIRPPSRTASAQSRHLERPSRATRIDAAVCHGHAMQMDADRCREQLAAARHGVLGTVHAARGVDAVPVVFVVDGERIVIPIDTVKPKAGARLQRLRNLDADAAGRAPRRPLRRRLVRSSGGSGCTAGPTRPSRPPTQLERLAAAFPAYAEPGSVTSVIVLVPDEVAGWAAGPLDA